MHKDRRIVAAAWERLPRPPSTYLAALLATLACGCSGTGPSDPSPPISRAPAPSAPKPVARIDPLRIDDGVRITLIDNTHPNASPVYDVGAAPDQYPLEHMQLVLKRDAASETALVAQIDALHDRTSPSYHQWLTATQFGDQYGVSAGDIATISRWLQFHGMRVDGVPPSRMFIEFSATAGQVREAFHTEVHLLDVKGQRHIGNMSDPQIPAALADVVAGVSALHDFMPHPLHQTRGPIRRGADGWHMVGPTPSFTINDGTSGTFYAVAPADFATIYNLNPLFTEGYRGAGETVVVIEDTTIKNATDVSTFRSAFGLSGYAGTFTQIRPTGAATCSVSGVNAAEGEAALDAEWAGASAPDAAIELASCKDTTTVFGGLIAIENLINSATPPPILSMSYGECESFNGSTANTLYSNTYEQAASEGISVFVSSGDEGAASCDANLAAATHGITVSGFASTAYNVAVGGTDFMDTYDADNGGPAVTKYWSATNSATTLGSALSYIPEIPWNDACTSQLIFSTEGYAQGYGTTGFCATTKGASFITTASGSGGPSATWSQPTWQTGVIGLPTKSGGKRYLPDVSLFAANGVWGHFYIYCLTDTAEGGGPCTYSVAADAVAFAAGGTSFAAPALAGIQALVNQSTGAKQGNPNYTYYKLAAAEFGPRGTTRCNSSRGTTASPTAPDEGCIFYDVTQGDMDVPCTGTTNCFGYSKSGATTYYGALSTSSTSFGSAYAAGTGWDYATGLGTVNAYNLVHAW